MTTPSIDVLTAPAGLSTLMREGSQAEHKDAEGSTFMARLLDAQVNETGYSEYLAMLRPVYAALESVGERLAADPASAPIVDAVVDPALARLGAIDADLAHWSGGRPPVVNSPAVDAYVARIEATEADPLRYLAHHYTRYLGDLSGGQAIGKILERGFGLDGGVGVAFYRFDAVPKPKPYKDAYRARLDALPLTADQQQAVVDEVKVVFGLNGALFAELSQQLPRFAR